jgi:hypothetical protein
MRRTASTGSSTLGSAPSSSRRSRQAHGSGRVARPPDPVAAIGAEIGLTDEQVATIRAKVEAAGEGAPAMMVRTASAYTWPR